ncbi:MAG: hypothetical protein GXZ19_11690 [Bacteroidales bacterium]|nr:hypothetical protein [Bacteroidales bacterium]
MEEKLSPVTIRFNHTSSQEHRISFLETRQNLKGNISVDKLIYDGFGKEEHLIFSVVTEDGTQIDDDMIDRIMELPATIIGKVGENNSELEGLRQLNTQKRKAEIEQTNKEYFLAESAKLDAFSEDLKEGLQRELKDLSKEITEKKHLFKASADKSLAEMLEMKEEVIRLEEKRKRLRREIYDREDEIDAQNEHLQDEIRAKLDGAAFLENIMSISFEIV